MNPRARGTGNPVVRHRWIRIGGWLAALTAVFGCAAFFAGPLLSGPALTQLIVPGPLLHVQPQAVRAALLPALQGKGFFSVNVAQLRKDVLAVPWVASAAVRRSWPHTLYIDITEELPVARWNGNGLMDAQGRVFAQSAAASWAKLPVLNGTEGNEQDVLAEFNDLNSQLTAHGLAMLQLTVDARGDSSVSLNDGIQVRLGRSDALQRLQRFLAVALPTLSSRLAAVAYVDMRYTNGFAVGWKSQMASSGQHKEVRPNG
ncbi:MAG: cell division protein FtsQ/DivIB [Gammaproteobacteria bacterium]|nr:cell division protein FtsQ/DivIB [Gammaproteobacteria bacterium]MDE2345151.1 cell division protein FtsQ/DivIB [Gammaproteobacteria bacterium]